MAAALPAESQKLALELHGVLSDLDPSRWHRGAADRARSRLSALEMRVAHLAHESWPDQVRRLREALSDLRVAIRQDLPDEEGSAANMKARWMAFRASMIPRYEALQAGLRDHAIHVPSLRPTNHARNIFHVTSALACVAIMEFLPSMAWGIAITVPLAVWAWTMELMRPTRPRLNAFFMGLFGPIAHPHEHTRVNSGTWYITALAALALFTTPPTAALGLVVLGLGDPVAALVGRRFGSIKLIHGRTLEGTLAFVVVSVAAGVAALLLLQPSLPIHAVLIMAGSAALGGAIAELVSLRVDDNFSVPVAAALAAIVAQSLLV